MGFHNIHRPGFGSEPVFLDTELDKNPVYKEIENDFREQQRNCYRIAVRRATMECRCYTAYKFDPLGERIGVEGCPTSLLISDVLQVR
jgi:hypothetical protein